MLYLPEIVKAGPGGFAMLTLRGGRDASGRAIRRFFQAAVYATGERIHRPRSLSGKS
jgi:hypothetical protein